MLICVAGYPGNGKTTVGRLLAGLYGKEAVVVDPDVTRLEVQGRAPTERIRSEDCTPEINRATIARMVEKTNKLLEDGKIVIVPSAFIGPQMRQEFETIAKERQVPFAAVWLTAPLNVLRERALNRKEQGDRGIINETTISAVGPDKIPTDEIPPGMTWPVIQSDRPRDRVLGDLMQHLPSPPPPGEAYGPPVA